MMDPQSIFPFSTLPSVILLQVIGKLHKDDRRSLSQCNRLCYATIVCTKNHLIDPFPSFELLYIDRLSLIAVNDLCPRGKEQLWACAPDGCGPGCKYPTTRKKKYDFANETAKNDFLEKNGWRAHFNQVNFLIDHNRFDEQLEMYSKLWDSFDCTYFMHTTEKTVEVLYALVHKPFLSTVWVTALQTREDCERFAISLDVILRVLTRQMTNVTIQRTAKVTVLVAYTFPVAKTKENGQTTFTITYPVLPEGLRSF